MGEIEIISIYNIFCRKFGAVCRKIATFCPSYFFNQSDATGSK